MVTWSPLPVQETSVLASPQFKRVNRKWRLYFKQGIVRLQFVQGLEDISICVGNLACPCFCFIKLRNEIAADSFRLIHYLLTSFFSIIKWEGDVNMNSS